VIFFTAALLGKSCIFFLVNAPSPYMMEADFNSLVLPLPVIGHGNAQLIPKQILCDYLI
jgi:hypothetical protein